MNKRLSREVVHLDGKKAYFEEAHHNLDEFEKDEEVSHLLIIAFNKDGHRFSTRTNITEDVLPNILEHVAAVVRDGAKDNLN